MICQLNFLLFKVMSFFSFFLTYMLLYLFMAMLSFHCCTWAFSSCKKWELLSSCNASLVAEHVLQVAWASVVATGAHQLWLMGPRACTLISCGMQAQLLCGMWNLPVLGMEPISPALEGRFLSTVPSEKSFKVLS